MIKIVDTINLELLQELFNGKHEIILIKNAGKNVLKDLVNIKDIWITDNHEDDIPLLGIHANNKLPWHIDRILQDPVFCINNLYCKKFESGASPTMFSIMRRNISDNHKNVYINYTMLDKIDNLKIKNNFKNKTKTYKLVQQDDYGEYYFYTSKISDKDYSFLWNDMEYQYVHNWEVGDLILWNNYTVAHKRLESKSHSREFIKQYFLDENEIFGERKLI